MLKKPPVVVDTNVWVAHFIQIDPVVIKLNLSGRLLMHQMVIGELALGMLESGLAALKDLQLYEPAATLPFQDVYDFVLRHGLSRHGIQWVDANILASAAEANAKIYTFDKKLRREAARLGLSYDPT